jgi:hypothetical protein
MKPLFFIITLSILIIYAIVLYNITGKNRSAGKLLWAFGIIAFVGFVFHMHLFCVVTRNNFSDFSDGISRLLFSIQYSLEMFIANTIMFKGEVMGAIQDKTHLFYIFVPLYGAALLTSGFTIFHFLSRRLYTWFWLATNKQNDQKAHIFVGINKASEFLAADIAKLGQNDKIIFIDLPDQQDSPQGLSVWDIIGRFFKDSEEVENLSEYTVLKEGRSLRRLTEWFKSEKTSVYILSDDQARNLSALESLWERGNAFECKIYCHAKKEGLVNTYDSITDVKNRVTFVDSSYLAIESLKKSEGELLPVHFVDIATDSTGTKRLGYVESPFCSAILGFGETGKEALKFLYEFGAFPDKNNKKAPFTCHIFDCNLDKEINSFGLDLKTTKASDAVNAEEFILHPFSIGNEQFKEEIAKIANDLNYIVVCLGDDNLNIKTAMEIAEYITMQGRNTAKNFCIAIKQSQISKLNMDTLDKANKIFNNCLHPFGMLETTWKLSVISNEKMDADARRFFDSYSVLSKAILARKAWPSPDWKARDEDSRGTDYKKRCKAKRQIAQDYSNCLHIATKRALCEGSGITSDMILDIHDNSTHCTGPYGDILEHLAVGEHMRWEASHRMMGYKFSAAGTDDIKKLHECIKPYFSLDEDTKHFDWLVVKNSI